MSGLDDIRRKRRRKGEPVTLADLTAPDRGAVATASSPRASAQPLDSINFVAYLRHVAMQDPQRRAVMAARRTPTGELAFTTLSFQQLDERSDRLARGFSMAGWSRGQRVMVLAQADADSLAAIVALLKNGAVPVLVDPRLPRKDIASCVKQAGSPVLLTDSRGLLDRYVPGGPFASVRTTVLLDAWLPAAIGRLTPLGRHEVADDARVHLAATRPADPALIAFTSGGARSIRAVILDHGTLIAQVEAMRRARWIADGEAVLANDLRHALLLLALGAGVVLPRCGESARGTADRLVACVDALGVSTVVGSPATWRAVAEHCVQEGRMLPGVRQLLLVGGPTNVATHQSIARVLPAGEARAVYGTTEAFPAAAIGSGEVIGETSALTEKGAGLCLGRTVPGIDAAIIDFGAAGRHVEVGEVGEICLEGAAVAPCESLLHQDSQGLWQRTGDLGWRDRQGRLWLVARQGRVALTRFGPAYPVSCEQVFETHERVRRALVVGVGRPGEQEAVLIVEPAAGAWPKDDVAKISFQRDLLEMGQSKGITREIRRALFVKRMPLDRLHHAQPRIDDVLAWLERTGGTS